MIEPTFINDEVSRDLGEAIAFARAEGLSAIELRMIGDTNVVQLPLAELRRIRDRLDAAGLRVAAVATPLFKCPLDAAPGDAGAGDGAAPDGGPGAADPDPFRAASHDLADHFALVPRAADAAAVLGTTKLRCFAFLGTGDLAPVRAEVVRHLRRAGELLAAHAPAARLCLENEHTTYVRTAAEVGSIVRELGAPFEVLWDPGNAYVSGERGARLGFDAIEDLVTHIHLKDPQVDGDVVRFVPVGQGEIDYAEQARAWAASGYRGYVSLEPHILVGHSSLPGARACLAYLRPLLAEVARRGPAMPESALHAPGGTAVKGPPCCASD